MCVCVRARLTSDFVLLPLARPAYVHLKHKVGLNRAGVTGSHASSHLVQQRGQTPHVSQDRGQELIRILNTPPEKTVEPRGIYSNCGAGGSTSQL